MNASTALLARRPLRLGAALLAATLLASCGAAEPAKPASTFTPVAVTPVIGDVPLGSPDAKIEFVEYAALTCHVCRDFAKQIFPRLKSTYIDTGKIRYIYRDYTLETGPDGKASDGFGVVLASVARCKGPEHYNEVVNSIFTAQADLLDAARTGNALPILADVAAKHDISVDEMRTCIDYQPELKASIKKAHDDANETLKITGTPTIYIDGEQIPEKSWENISSIIEAKLAGTYKPADPAAPVAPPAQ